jgi:hypothetical protein
MNTGGTTPWLLEISGFERVGTKAVNALSNTSVWNQFVMRNRKPPNFQLVI